MTNNIQHALQVQTLDISQLKEDPKNARKHNRRNLDAIKASLLQFGQRKAIVVQKDGMVVVAGNGTMAAARELGWSKIAGVVIDEDTNTARKFAVADNRTGELAQWDVANLGDLLKDWEAEDRIGFSDGEVSSLLASLQAGFQSALTTAGSIVASIPGQSVGEAIFAPPTQPPSFSPTLTPTVGPVPQVTAAHIERSQQEITQTVVGEARTYSDVTCPSCLHELKIEVV